MIVFLMRVAGRAEGGRKGQVRGTRAITTWDSRAAGVKD